MKYITKGNVEIEVLYLPFHLCELNNDDKLRKKFRITNIEWDMGKTEIKFDNGETCFIRDFIVKYPDGTCHAYSKELFEMLFVSNESVKLMQQIDELYQKISFVEESFDNVSIVVPKKHRDLFKRTYSIKTSLGYEIKNVIVYDEFYRDIKIKFEEINEPYIKIK